MKRTTTMKTAGMLAMAALMIAGTAQAGMGPCMSGAAAPTPGCGNATGSAQACPVQGGHGQPACPNSNQALGEMMGQMAAGGIQIAASVMRTLAGEAARQGVSEPGM